MMVFWIEKTAEGAMVGPVFGDKRRLSEGLDGEWCINIFDLC